MNGKRLFWFSAVLMTCSVAAAQMMGYGLGFNAPTVYNKDNVSNAVVGEIIFDTSDHAFWGRYGDGPTDWVSFGSGSVVPAGSIMAYSGTTDPTGYFIADGRAVSRTAYSSLFAAISTTYGQGDGSTTFNIPDLRGRFLRGVNGGSGRDPDAASRTAMAPGGNTGDNVGSVQTDALKSHSHTTVSTNNLSHRVGSTGGPNDTWYADSTGSPNTGSTGGNETRPINAYVNFIIKY